MSLSSVTNRPHEATRGVGRTSKRIKTLGVQERLQRTGPKQVPAAYANLQA